MDSGSGLESGSTEDYETDVELLKRAWRQEKAAPGVLQFEGAMIRRIIEWCCADLQTHLEKSVLLQLPSTYQSVFRQSSEKETDMVPRPHLDTFVVCKTKYYLGHIQLEDNADGESDSSASQSQSQRPLDEPFEMEPNVLYFVRFKAVKKFVEEGKIDLC